MRRLARPARVQVHDQQLTLVGHAEQRVAGAQRVVDERERAVLGERDQPQRELGHLDRHRVLVDAVQAALGDEPVAACVLALAAGSAGADVASAPSRSHASSSRAAR